MKILSLLSIVLLFLMMFFAAECANTTFNFVHARNTGDWSPLIQAQDIGNIPSNFYICKVALRESRWFKTLWNCNCGRRWYRGRKSWRCNWCDNYFMTQTDAVKVTFCSILDWNKQIQKTIESGKPATGGYRWVTCPKNQYANKIAMRFGWEQDTDTGLVAVEMKCQTPDLKQSSHNWDGNKNYSQHWISSFSENPQQQFASTFKTKFERGGKITGLSIGFQRMVQVTSITFDYAKVQIFQPTETVIQTLKVTNYHTEEVVSKMNFTKNFTTKNRWDLEKSEFADYKITDAACASPLPYVLENSEPQQNSLYVASIEKFRFNKDLIATFTPNQQLVTVIRPGKQVTVKSIVKQQKVSLPFQATLTVANDINVLQPIVIKGIWTGVMALPVEVVITENDAPPKPQENLTKQNPASNQNETNNNTNV